MPSVVFFKQKKMKDETSADADGFVGYKKITENQAVQIFTLITFLVYHLQFK